MQEHHRLALWIAARFPIQVVTVPHIEHALAVRFNRWVEHAHGSNLVHLAQGRCGRKDQ